MTACVVAGCRRARKPSRNGWIYAACPEHTVTHQSEAFRQDPPVSAEAGSPRSGVRVLRGALSVPQPA
jgi:hypothetical protein